MNKLYNVATWFWHKFFHAPISLTKAYDNNVKNAQITIVFLHGISANSDTWKRTFAHLSKEKDLTTVRIVALDLLGFGKSLKADWLKYNETEYSKALDVALRRLKMKGKRILVGHSMGSLIAANYAVNFENRIDLDRLILVSPPVLMADELAKLPDKAYAKSYGALHRIAVTVPAAETIAKLVQRFSSFRSEYVKTAAFERSMENIILNRKNYQTFTNLRIPTVIIHGHFDPLVMGSNLRRAAKRNPRYIKYVSVIGQHDLSVGKRAKILLEIRKMLKEERKHETI